MDNIKSAIMHLAHTMREQEQGTMIPFEEFLEMLVSDPQAILRNVFQIFHDMVRSSVGEGINEYPDDPENIGFVYYDCSRLFVEGADRPFFADRLFANRLVHLVEALKRGSLSAGCIMGMKDTAPPTNLSWLPGNCLKKLPGTSLRSPAQATTTLSWWCQRSTGNPFLENSWARTGSRTN